MDIRSFDRPLGHWPAAAELCYVAIPDGDGWLIHLAQKGCFEVIGTYRTWREAEAATPALLNAIAA
jgi:hypothetical protein